MADEVCANCGKAAVDNIKLKKCACNLVKYCSVVCQKNHIGSNIKRHARKGLLNYGMIVYLHSPTRATGENVKSAACHYRLTIIHD